MYCTCGHEITLHPGGACSATGCECKAIHQRWKVTPVCAEVHVENRQTADVAILPKRKKLALCGFATNTLATVPWDDPEFEIWGMNQGYVHMQRRADRWFEMHLPEATPDIRDPHYLTFLREMGIPVYMIQCYDYCPTSVRYPIEDAIRLAGRDYFTSTVAFMLALAEMEGHYQEVHLYGINLAIGDEWFYEKPCAEYWIGRLEAKGIKIVIPAASSMMKQWQRYGYAVDARPHQNLKMLVNAKKGEAQHALNQHTAQANVQVGRMQMCEELVQVFEGVDHLADVVLMPTEQPTPMPPTPQAMAPGYGS